MSAPKSLKRRLTVPVLSGLILLGVLSSLINVTIAYFDHHEQIENETSILVEALSIQAEVAAFARSDEIADETIAGLMSFNAISRVQISTDDGFFRAASVNIPSGIAKTTKTYPLFSPLDDAMQIGSLQITSNSSMVSQRVSAEARRQMLISIAQVLAIFAIVWFSYQFAVARPFFALAGEIASLEPGTRHRLRIQGIHDDELGRMAAATNKLLDSSSDAIEKERSMRQQLEAAEAQYRRIFDSSKVGIVAFDGAGTLTNCNDVFSREVLEATAHGSQSSPGSDDVQRIFQHPNDAWNAIERAHRVGVPVGVDLALNSLAPTSYWVHCIFSVMVSAKNTTDHIEAIVYDVTGRRSREERATFMAEHDPLTGIYNRYGVTRAFERLTEQECDRDSSIAVGILDLDKFKQVNDSLGHGAGDEVLRAIAGRLSGAVRRSRGFVGRLGGDEFLLTMIVKNDKVRNLADRFRSLLNEITKPIRLQEANTSALVSASIGIATYPQDGNTLDELLRQADETMYRIKKSGRNNFALHSVPYQDNPRPTS